MAILNTADKLMHGGVAVSKVFHGTTQVWSSAPPASLARYLSGRNLRNSTPATNAGGTYRLQQKSLNNVAAVEMSFGNWQVIPGLIDPRADQLTPNSFIINACYVEVGSAAYPVTFSGSGSVTLAPGENVIGTSTVTINAGQTFWIRTSVAPVGGSSYPRISAASTFYPGELWAPGVNVANGTGDLSTYTSSAFGPNWVRGVPIGTKVPAVHVFGDSIVFGEGDSFANPNETGMWYRGLENVRPHGITALSGESAKLYLTSSSQRSLLVGPGADYVICEYGINDMQGGDNLATVQATLLTVWSNIKTAYPAVKIQQATITPKSASTDNWATTGNQTTDGAVNPVRVLFNNWIRDGAPIISGVAVATGTSGALRAGSAGHPLSGYQEIADAMETERNSGKWNSGYTGDGIHPNTVGHIAGAAAIDFSKLS